MSDRFQIQYLRQTNRDERDIALIEAYLKRSGMFRDRDDETVVFSEVVELDLTTVVTCLSGPKRPHDKVDLTDMKRDFEACLTNKIGFKGYGIPTDKLALRVPFTYEGVEYTISHGSVLIAAITSCTNTSNPSVMLGAGRLTGLRAPHYLYRLYIRFDVLKNRDYLARLCGLQGCWPGRRSRWI